MTSIVRVGCDVDEIHRRYAAIHSALFGAAAFRQIIAAMTGRTAKTYQGYLQTLEQLQVRLSESAATVPIADPGSTAHLVFQLRAALTEYITALDAAIAALHGICSGLLNDEDAYRAIPKGGRSAFNRDKTAYDRVLVQLEQQGRRLNRLFSRF